MYMSYRYDYVKTSQKFIWFSIFLSLNMGNVFTHSNSTLYQGSTSKNHSYQKIWFVFFNSDFNIGKKEHCKICFYLTTAVDLGEHYD